MTADRNLVLVHTEGWQALSDFMTIKQYVEEMAPDIEIFVASNLTASYVMRKKAARRPSLIFSPLRLMQFHPLRGKVYAGTPMSKLVEMQRLVTGGIPVPRFEEIRPDTRLQRDSYGPYTVVKPSSALASWGAGIELFRTEDVRYRPPAAFPEDHPGHYDPMIAQKFVDCGHAMSCRVLTLFGAPIFTYLRQSRVPLALDAMSGPFHTNDFMPATEKSNASITHDAEILALAARAYKAMPEIALQACDILRDKHGNLHLLEINPGGGTWAFSSENAAGYAARLGVDDLTAAFDAFRTCARVLIERTRAEAI